MSSRPSSAIGLSETERRKYQSMVDFDKPEPNPFAFPADEKLFTFKEEEKERKAELRRINSGRSIYDKNRPSREGILRKINEVDSSGVRLNVRYRRVQSAKVPQDSGIKLDSRNKNKESRYKLIEKKREMFLVQ